MRKIRIIIAALVTAVFFYSSAYARQITRSGVDAAGSVAGQVSVTNVDSADSAIRLNGAQIKIVNKDTGEETTDTIMENGSLVRQLPLGNYSLTQVTAPTDYQLNTKSYEFSLQVPPGGEASNIKVVNATILMTNDAIAAGVAPVDATADAAPVEETAGAAPVDAAADTSGGENPGGAPAPGDQAPVDQGPVQEMISTPELETPAALDQGAAEPVKLISAERNPVTADNSNMLLATIVFCFIIMAGGLISRRYMINRL